MDFDLPEELAAYLVELDEFIENEIRPLERQDDNIRFFDHRREDARTDWDRGGLPNREWELLLREARRRADAAGHYRYPFPAEYGGKDGTNLGMAVIREHLARKGLGLHCDLQNEHAIVGNNVGLLLMLNYGTEAQKKEWVDDLAEGRRGFAFGITEPDHGSDATFMETRAERDGDEWVINGEKTWNTGIHVATYDLIFARTSGEPGEGRGITAFLVPTDSPGFKVDEFLWTFNMPTDHAHITLARRPRAQRRHLRRRGPRAPGGAALLQREPHPPGRLQPRGGPVLHRPGRRVREDAQAVRQGAGREPGHPVPARRAADPVRDAAGPHPQDGVGDGPLRAVLRSPTRCRCATTGPTGSAARPPTGPCRSTAGSATRATCPSSTSTATIAATGSPRAPRRSRCAGWPATCSGSCARPPPRE